MPDRRPLVASIGLAAASMTRLEPMPTATTTQDPHSPVPSRRASDMVRLGPGNVGTSGAFEFVAPASGTVFLRILGTGQVVNVAFMEGGSVFALNNGVALTSGAFFEFQFAVDGQEQLFVSGTSLTQAVCFWRPY